LALAIGTGPIGSTASPFISNETIIRLAQSLTEAVNQLASGLRRSHNLIEELGRRENFYLDLAGGSSCRAAGTVFHNAHLADKLFRANRAKKDALAIEFPKYLNGTAEKAKNIVRRVSLSEEDFSFGEVRASHCSPLNQQPWRNPTRANYPSTSAGVDASKHMRGSDGFSPHHYTSTGSHRTSAIGGAAEPRTNH
jgi:hypothetical protein